MNKTSTTIHPKTACTQCKKLDCEARECIMKKISTVQNSGGFSYGEEYYKKVLQDTVVHNLTVWFSKTQKNKQVCIAEYKYYLIIPIRISK